MAIVQHSSKSNRWFTPSYIIDAVHNTLGFIDLDPASEEEANRVVRATTFYSEGGLEKPWYGNVFCNPPGGRGNAKKFWEKLIESEIRQAVFLCFSLEHLRTFQTSKRPPTSFPFCIPKKRIAFVGAGIHPSHPNAIIYVPGKADNTVGFVESFQSIGVVIR